MYLPRLSDPESLRIILWRKLGEPDTNLCDTVQFYCSAQEDQLVQLIPNMSPMGVETAGAHVARRSILKWTNQKSDALGAQ